MAINKKILLSEPKTEFDVTITGFAHPVPCIFLPATNPNVDAVVIYLHGLNGSKDSLHFLRRHLTNAHIIGYDARACGKNLNEPSIHVNNAVNDLALLIQTLKQDLSYLNIKRFYLTGESFGAAVCLIYCKKFQDVQGILIWNLPCKIIDVTDTPKTKQLKVALPLMWTLLTNLPTYDYAPSPVEKLSNNRTLILATKLIKQKTLNDNRNIIAAWLGNHHGWNTMLSKSFMQKTTARIIYISSEQDPLRDHKKVNRLDAILNSFPQNRILHYDLKIGTHVLIYDINMDEFILKGIEILVDAKPGTKLSEIKEELHKVEEACIQHATSSPN